MPLMPAVIITESELVADPDGDMIRLEYRLPGGALDDDHPKYDGHTHWVSVAAVWLRMAEYGITKEEALEEVVLERCAPDLLKSWPNAPTNRTKARARHNASQARQHARHVREMTTEEAAKIARRTTAGRAAEAKAQAEDRAARKADADARHAVLKVRL